MYEVFGLSIANQVDVWLPANIICLYIFFAMSCNGEVAMDGCNEKLFFNDCNEKFVDVSGIWMNEK